jgi:hypothetical protein
VTWRDAVLGAGLLLIAVPGLAQDAGDGFLFKPPSGAFTVRGGLDRANASSDIFTFVTDQLTVARGDFRAGTIAFDVAVRLKPRAELAFSLGVSQSTTPSEFRRWEDNNNQPIQQTTTFMRAPLTASLKMYLAGPGRAVGHFAWIPSRYAPYVGAGGGVMWYRFRQAGDFIDFGTTKIFGDLFDSTGWTPTAQGFVGTDVSLTPRFALTGEIRYQFAKASLGRDYAGFGRIDLSGLAATGGVSIRY